MQPIDLSQIDLNLLHTFRIVVDEGGVGRAAHVLKRTQPAITARLQQLEDALGVKLFQRVGRGLALSIVGRAIEARVREVLAGLQEILDEARSAVGKPAGLLRVGALPTVSAYRLAPVLTQLLADWSELRVQIRHGLTQPQVQHLLQGKLDIVFSVGPPPRDSRLRVEAFGVARPVVVLRAGMRGIPRGALPVARVAAHNLVLFGKEGDLFFDAVWAFLERHRLGHGARIHVPHIQTLKALVLAGSGITILPDYTVVESGLVTRALQGLRLAHPIWMAMRKGSEAIPAVAELVQRLRIPSPKRN
jgi:DNA-binding transcriptional LysR family regulator